MIQEITVRLQTHTQIRIVVYLAVKCNRRITIYPREETEIHTAVIDVQKMPKDGIEDICNQLKRQYIEYQYIKH